MTPRQRMLDAIEYKSPDKIPVIHHPSPAGLHVHGEKLLDLFKAYPPDNPIDLDGIPSPSEEHINTNGQYHEIRRDEWGTDWDLLIFGIQGHPKAYPFPSWKSALESYDFPPFPAFNAKTLNERQQEYLVFAGGISIFEKLHALRPMDEVLVDIFNEDPSLLSFLDKLTEYYQFMIEKMLDTGVDVIMFGDDWGTQQAPIISPHLFRKIFKPRYERLMAPIREARKKIFFHSCGFLGRTIDELIDLGVNGLWPQIGLFDSEPSFLNKCVENKVAIFIHPDRQYLIPMGSPDEIDSAIREYALRHHSLGGGGMFYIEVENDAPFENVKALFESIDKWR